MGFVLIAAMMSRGGLERVMYCLEGEVEQERFILGADFMKPFNGLISQDVCHVALKLLSLPIDVQCRVKVFSLSLKTGPVVKTRARGVIIVAHVPFSDECRVIACGLQVLGKKHCAIRHRALVIHDAVVVHILPGKDGGPAWGTERSCHKRITEVGSLGRQFVQVRSFKPLGGLGVESHKVVAVVVTDNQDQVLGCLAEACHNQNEEADKSNHVIMMNAGVLFGNELSVESVLFAMRRKTMRPKL